MTKLLDFGSEGSEFAGAGMYLMTGFSSGGEFVGAMAADS
jgi:hypothetical protein